MTQKRAREAALRIQLLLEIFNQEELEEGLAILGALKGEDILQYLARRTVAQHTRKRAIIKNRPFKTDELFALKRTDPNKYKLVQEFADRIREGAWLPTMDDCRSFGKELSKDFEAGKSRKDAVPRLIDFVSKLNVEDIRAAISRAKSYRVDSDSSEPFQRLASHIISGASR